MQEGFYITEALHTGFALPKNCYYPFRCILYPMILYPVLCTFLCRALIPLPYIYDLYALHNVHYHVAVHCTLRLCSTARENKYLGLHTKCQANRVPGQN